VRCDSFRRVRTAIAFSFRVFTFSESCVDCSVNSFMSRLRSSTSVTNLSLLIFNVSELQFYKIKNKQVHYELHQLILD